MRAPWTLDCRAADPCALRGGAWSYNPDNCRAARRKHNRADERNNKIGFRVFRGSHIVNVPEAGGLPPGYRKCRSTLPAEAGQRSMAQVRLATVCAPCHTAPARKLRAAYYRGQPVFAVFDARVQGWIAHAGHGDTWGLRRQVLAYFVLRSGDVPGRPGRGAK